MIDALGRLNRLFARRSIRNVLPVIALAAFLVFGVVATAHAVTITNWYSVAPKGVVGASAKVIVRGAGANDGFPMNPATAKLYIDDVLIPRSSYTASAPMGREVYFYYSPRPPMNDGLRTFRVEMSDSVGKLSSYTWSAMVAQPPGAVWIEPSADWVMYSGYPRISVLLSDNTPATALTLAGEIRTGSSTGPVVRTFGATGLAVGEHSFTLSEELPPGTYYLTGTVTDAAGNINVLTGASARRFVLEAAPAMSVMPSNCLAAGCHVRTGHPATGDCASCHVAYYHENQDCGDCHVGHSGPVTVTDMFGNCEVCHNPSNPSVPRHTLDSVRPAHESGCSGCHNESLLDRHGVIPSGSSYAYQCGLCHETDDARVSAAVVAGDTSCGACHDVGPNHGFDPQTHTSEIEGEGLAGTWPYVDSTAQVSGVLMNQPYAYSDVVCLDCHTSVIAGPSGEHSKPDASSAGAGCGNCHPTPRDTFTAWDKTCYQCHPLSTVHDEADLSVKHTIAGSMSAPGSCGYANPNNGRRPCHYSDIVQEHNRLINPQVGFPNTVLSVTCQECHAHAATTTALADGWDGTCTDCHDGVALPNHAILGSVRYNQVYALHNNPGGFYDSGAVSGSGAPVQGYNAMDAHGPVRTNPSGGPNATVGCGAPTCHTQAYAGGGWPFSTGPACAECHGPNVAPVTPYEGDYAWYSDTWVDGESLDTRLTMTLDPITLPAGSTLEFMTYYDIEQDWDHGYVQVSTDAGQSWTNLASSLTTNDDPHGTNLGNGITGSSGGWVPASFDLSAYGGQSVMLRFYYLGDYYVYGQGWMLDLIAVGPPGSPVFSDDVETLRPEWEVESTVSYWTWDDQTGEDVFVTEPTTETGWRRYTP